MKKVLGILFLLITMNCAQAATSNYHEIGTVSVVCMEESMMFRVTGRNNATYDQFYMSHGQCMKYLRSMNQGIFHGLKLFAVCEESTIRHITAFADGRLFVDEIKTSGDCDEQALRINRSK